MCGKSDSEFKIKLIQARVSMKLIFSNTLGLVGLKYIRSLVESRVSRDSPAKCK